MAGSTIELTEESTHDDIQAAVDQIIAEAGETVAENGESETSNKSDSEMVSDQRSAVVDDSEASDQDVSDVPEKDESSSSEAEWITDDLKAEMSAYGIEEGLLSDFASREELDRALNLIDKSAMEAGRKAMADGEVNEEQARDDAGKFTSKEDGKPSETSFDVKLDRDDYPDDLIDEFTRMRDHYESRFRALEERVTEDQAVAEEREFDKLVDAIGHKELFGVAGKENDKQLKRREDLFVAVKAQKLGLSQFGRNVELDENLVSRVARMVFPDETKKKELKAQTRKIARQSNGRQGGGATRPTDPPESARDYARQLYAELDRQ
tara:strand:- start:1152 stop:2120 length:969 start_codon:yes stop_codon:yes gene_type:complete